jgi:hypothetical protein
MAFTPDLPFEKSRGDLIRAKDWNDAVHEIQRLDTDKVDKTNATLTGPLGFTNAVTPMFYIFESGTNNAQRPVIAHSPAYPNWGLAYRDSDDTMIFQGNGNPALSIELGNGNVGIGTPGPQAKLEVIGAVAINDGTGFAVKNGVMTSGSLTIGSTSKDFGGGSDWNSNMAGLLLETLDNTEIAVHDRNERFASLMYYEGGNKNRITIGRNMGWASIDSVAIHSGDYKLVMQSDGNLVLYNKAGKAIWATGTVGK